MGAPSRHRCDLKVSAATIIEQLACKGRGTTQFSARLILPILSRLYDSKRGLQFWLWLFSNQWEPIDRIS